MQTLARTGMGLRVALRAVTEADLPELFEHQREPLATARAAFPPRDWPAFLEHWRVQVLADATVSARVIVVDGAVAGNVVAWTHAGARLVGYWVGSAWWGRGVATAALRAFVEEVELGRPLDAWVAVGNVASRRVVEKVGFVPTGAVRTDELGVEEQGYRLGGR